jgi:lipid-A-disaccharide synthase
VIDLFVVAGEASGDQLGEGLLQALKPSHLKIMGIGGPKMRAVGMETIFPMEDLQVMGFIDVLFSLPSFDQALLQNRRRDFKSPA